MTCGCLDYEPVDPDDSLCFECACGHVQEEHLRGFFRRCKFTHEDVSE